MKMRDLIVALDIETTGLDPNRDAIIEIGAVKFRGYEVLDTWSTLVNPGRPLSPYIVQLTGITQADVNSAPPLSKVLPSLRRFVGDAPVLGHNIDFDLGFLRARGALLQNPALDTYELASVLLPNATRYSLSALARELGVPLESAHRALDDAMATRGVYLRLWEKVLKLPLSLLEEIVSAAQGLDWEALPVFYAALRERARRTRIGQESVRRPDPRTELIEIFGPSPAGWETLQPNDSLIPLDVDALAELFAPGGPISRAFDDYEYRPQQVEMMRSVARAFNSGRHLMIEAGTGTGKSIAYLVPAIYWAVQNNERVVISTNTINLQEQLLEKDIPLIRKALGIDFEAAVLKGRNNYLCPHRLAILRRRKPGNAAEMRMLAKILVWLRESTTGDRQEISLRGADEAGIWQRLSAEDEGCTVERCATHMHGACPFYKARRAAERAHILIVNHALLLSDVAVGNRVLPPYHYLIIDEAHHLERATTGGLSFHLNKTALKRYISDLGSPKTGLLGDILGACRQTIPPDFYDQLADYVNRIHEAASATPHYIDTLFDELREFIADNVKLQSSEYTQPVRITDTLRTRPGWGRVMDAWEKLSRFTSAIAEAMQRLAGGLGDLAAFDIPNYDDLVGDAMSASRRFRDVHRQMKALFAEPAENTIYWAELGPNNGRLSLHAAPLHVGPLLQKHLWSAKDTVVMTSATLTTAGAFDYIRERLNAHDMDELAVGSPFDYESATLLYLPTDIPEPSEWQKYQETVEQTLIRLCKATEGRTMVLFTSYSQLRRTAEAISGPLAAAGITVLEQRADISRTQLLDDFRTGDKMVLLGTRSFWEGVDVPGEALSVLVIVRLPFTVPSDPIFAARSEMFENSFEQYAVPEAVLFFRQGFGRLIRTKTDRGVVVILDRRVTSKRYGQAFLDSLPTCTIRRAPLAELPVAAKRWLNEPRGE